MATKTVKPSSGTVTVACKLPNGFVMRLAAESTINDPLFGGGSRSVKQFHPTEHAHTLAGPSHPQNAAPKALIVNGYALTPNIPADFWEAWLQQYHEHPAVKNKMIFAYANEADVREEAKDNEKLRSGLERLDPKNLPRGLKPETKVEVEA